jgi:potassium-transporting ATPase ATP-binding subunit
VGIAGMDRLVQRNVLAMSTRAVEAAGDIETLLLDKTGTITFGDRQANELIPVHGATVEELAEAARLFSLATRPRRAAALSIHAPATTACLRRPLRPRRAPSSCRSPRRPRCPGWTSPARKGSGGSARALRRPCWP